jgi:hypothetical protein
LPDYEGLKTQAPLLTERGLFFLVLDLDENVFSKARAERVDFFFYRCRSSLLHGGFMVQWTALMVLLIQAAQAPQATIKDPTLNLLFEKHELQGQVWTVTTSRKRQDIDQVKSMLTDFRVLRDPAGAFWIRVERREADGHKTTEELRKEEVTSIAHYCTAHPDYRGVGLMFRELSPSRAFGREAHMVDFFPSKGARESFGDDLGRMIARRLDSALAEFGYLNIDNFNIRSIGEFQDAKLDGDRLQSTGRYGVYDLHYADRERGVLRRALVSKTGDDLRFGRTAKELAEQMMRDSGQVLPVMAEQNVRLECDDFAEVGGQSLPTRMTIQTTTRTDDGRFEQIDSLVRVQWKSPIGAVPHISVPEGTRFLNTIDDPFGWYAWIDGERKLVGDASKIPRMNPRQAPSDANPATRPGR